MTAFDRLEEGTHYEIGEFVDPFGLVWWVYQCTTETGCEFQTTSASAVHADMSIREHIVTTHFPRRPVSLTVLGDYLGEPPC